MKFAQFVMASGGVGVDLASIQAHSNVRSLWRELDIRVRYFVFDGRIEGDRAEINKKK
jgi:hypothetical protein